MRVWAMLYFATLLASSAFGQLKAEPCDTRPADRDAIHAHIESIFRAFIDHDGPKLRATHAPEWRGFLEGSWNGIRGVESYMNSVDAATHPGPNGMKSYKITEFDCVLYGDTAIVPFVSDVHGEWNGQAYDTTLRIVDFYVKLNGAWIQAGSDTQAHPKALPSRMSSYQQISGQLREQLLAAREAVWRAYFANDRATLEKLLPEELIAIDPGNNQWSNREMILKGAERFAQSGNKLTKVEFPRTEIQTYGNVAQIYSTFNLEFEGAKGSGHESGRATETFVFREGKWINVGWHLDNQAPAETASAAHK